MDFLREATLANAFDNPEQMARHITANDWQMHPDWFGADVRERLESGRSSTSTEYSLARRTQAEMNHRFAQFFEQYDFLLLPTTPIPAPLIEGSDAVEQARRLTRFTAPFNLTGLPAISVPCGFSKEGLPIGLQIIAKAWNEAGVTDALPTPTNTKPIGECAARLYFNHKTKKPPHCIMEAVAFSISTGACLANSLLSLLVPMTSTADTNRLAVTPLVAHINRWSTLQGIHLYYDATTTAHLHLRRKTCFLGRIKCESKRAARIGSAGIRLTTLIGRTVCISRCATLIILRCQVRIVDPIRRIGLTGCGNTRTIFRIEI